MVGDKNINQFFIYGPQREKSFMHGYLGGGGGGLADPSIIGLVPSCLGYPLTHLNLHAKYGSNPYNSDCLSYRQNDDVYVNTYIGQRNDNQTIVSLVYTDMIIFIDHPPPPPSIIPTTPQNDHCENIPCYFRPWHRWQYKQACHMFTLSATVILMASFVLPQG